VNQPRTAYLFDVDGVLTNPETKRIELPGVFDELVRLLENLEPVGLNTGRSLDFISQVLDPIESRISDIKLLRNFFAIGEKGGVRIVYNELGQRITHVDYGISVAGVIQEEVRSLIKAKYSKTMFYDETKQTMVSIELLPVEQMNGLTFKDFKVAQKQLTAELHELLAKYCLESELRVDPTRIATDIENVHAGKALGARQCLGLLRERKINPEHVLVFGDSTSDYDMAEELYRVGLSVEFVFVGGRDLLDGKNKNDFLITFTKAHCDHGTLEYLKGIQLP
jgi:HAD superfamily hydrolase (TIGR01484 family)